MREGVLGLVKQFVLLVVYLIFFLGFNILSRRRKLLLHFNDYYNTFQLLLFIHYYSLCFFRYPALRSRWVIMCLFLSGIVGLNCDVNIDECISNPCQNGGECVDQVDNFKCICLVGFSGHLCEVRFFIQNNTSNVIMNFDMDYLKISVSTYFEISNCSSFFRPTSIYAIQIPARMTLPASTPTMTTSATATISGLEKTAHSLNQHVTTLLAEVRNFNIIIEHHPHVSEKDVSYVL